MKRTVRIIGWMLIVSGLSHIAAAQLTTATVIISDRYFEAKRVGDDLHGERINIISMSVAIDGSTIGTISANSLVSTSGIQISKNIPVTSSQAAVKIYVTFSHKEWHVGGGSGLNHPEHTNTVEFSLDPLSGSLTYPTKLFDQFTGLDDFPVFFTEVDWYFNYRVSISPFQPTIVLPGGKLCFENPTTLSLTDNNQGFDYTATFVWQYGFETVQWTTNWDFQMTFLWNVNYQIEMYYYSHYSEYNYISLDNIKFNISNTEYSFLNQFYEYFFQPDYHYFLASEMLSGIHNQQDYYLEDEEERFLNDYFIYAVLQVGDQFWYPPYEKTFLVNEWHPLEPSFVSGRTIEFIPGSLEHILPEQMNRVQISAIASSSSINGPRSSPVPVDINPRAPAFTLRSNPSCTNKHTGQIILENISGVDPSNEYYCTVGEIGAKIYFSGTSNTISVGPGEYTVYLYYANETGFEACPSHQTIIVGSNPVLSFSVISTVNPTCFEKNDGQISIKVTSHYLDYQYSIPGQTISNVETGTFTNLAAGEYVVQVKDMCTNIPSDPITITKPADVTFQALTKNDPTCLSSPNGLISLTGHGGTSTFDYQILNSSGTVEASASGASGAWSGNGLRGGSYTARVRSNGCIWKEQGIQLATVTPMSIEKVVIKESCYGQSTGEVILTGAGGIQPYRYVRNAELPQSSPTFTGLAAMQYTFKVLTGVEGCPDQVIRAVSVPSFSEIGITMTPTDIVCFGNGDGKINTEITGAASPYTLAWDKKKDDGSWENINRPFFEIDNLDKGEYRFRMVDANLCAASNTAQIREPELLKVESAIPADVVCFGENGGIAATASGGIGNYTYRSYTSGGASISGTAATMAVPAGDYFVEVKDENNCLATFGDAIRDYIVKVKGPSAPLGFTYNKSSFNGYNVTCNGSKTGSINISASGGYPGYIYSINGIEQPSDIFSNAGAGIYLVSTRDSKGCTVSQTVQINEPDPISIINPLIKPVNCFGLPQGEISITPVGGVTGTYRFKLDGQEVLSPGVFKSLYAKTYDIEVSDANGCRMNTLQTVPSLNPPISIIMIPEDVRCFGENNGTLNTTVSGGAGGFVYSWEIDRGAGWQPSGLSSHNITGLSPAAYRIKVTDSKNCSAHSESEIIGPSQAIVSSVNKKDIVCYGGKGSLEIQANGGYGEYSYFVSSDAGITYKNYNSGDLLTPASYTIKIRDSKGCELVKPDYYAITSPASPLDLQYELSKYGDYNISCHGKNDGTVSLLPAGGNGIGYTGYQLQLDGTDLTSGNFIKDLGAGSYVLSVMDGRGCRITKEFSLSEPESNIKLGIAKIEQPKCSYDSNGSVSLIAEGGNQPYEFSLDGGVYGSSSTFSDLAVGNHNFKVRDAYGCSEFTDISLVNLISEIKIDGIVTDAKCFGENSGTIDVNVSGGASPYSFKWLDDPAVTPLRSLLRKGSYTVNITDAAGCIGEKSFFVREPQYPLSISAIASPACAELKDGIVTANAGGGTPPYLFTIDKKSGYTSNSRFDVFSGSHNIYVSDLNNCLAETSVNVDVRNVKPDINFMLATSRYELDTLVLIDVSMPPPDKVTWEFSDAANVIDTGYNKASVRYNMAGLYPVKMTGLFGECTYTIEKLLNIAPFDPSVVAEDRDKDGIKSLKISPNPNNGSFELRVELFTKQKITVRIFDLSSRLLFEEILSPELVFTREIILPDTVLPGSYVLRVTSENDSRTAVFVISK